MNEFKYKVVWESGKAFYVREDTPFEQEQELLMRAYHCKEPPKIYCLCPQGESIEKPLAVKHRQKTDTYYLAKYPGTGPFHSNGCPHFSPDSLFNAFGKHRIQAIDWGNIVRIRLSERIQIKNNQAEKGAEKKPGDQKTKYKYEKLSLEGLLHLVWERSGLNKWYPKMKGNRSYGAVTNAIRGAAQHISVNGKRLSDLLVIGAPSSFKDDRVRNQAILHSKKRVIFLVEIDLNTEISHKDALPEFLPVKEGIDMPKVRISKQVWKKIRESKPHIFKNWLSSIIRRYGSLHLFGIGDVADGEIIVNSAILVRLTKSWIPVENAYEDRLARVLYERGRRFFKPLSYGLPSFGIPNMVLLDSCECDMHPLFIVLSKDMEKISSIRKSFAKNVETVCPNPWIWAPFADKNGNSYFPKLPSNCAHSPES